MALRASQEPVPDQRREDNARDTHENDLNSGVDMVRERKETTEEGE